MAMATTAAAATTIDCAAALYAEKSVVGVRLFISFIISGFEKSARKMDHSQSAGMMFAIHLNMDEFENCRNGVNMKPSVFLLCGGLFWACAHPQPAPKPEGQLLDDAALRQYRDDASGSSKPVRSSATVSLGKGEVDLSNWKSSEEAAGESADGSGDGMDASGQETARPMENLGVTNPSSPTAGVETPDDVDVDAGSRVEADEVPLVPSDE